LRKVVMKKLSPVIILLKPLNRPPPGGWLHLNPPVHIEHGPGFSPHSLPAVQLYFHRLHIISNYTVVSSDKTDHSGQTSVPYCYNILWMKSESMARAAEGVRHGSKINSLSSKRQQHA
jgi:hypothetical protein